MQSLQLAVAEEAARIMCEQGVNDFRLAKDKAAENLGLSGSGSIREVLPNNQLIEDALREVAWEGDEDRYQSRLRAMRSESVKAMRMLAEFEPRLTGGALNGAITPYQPVQIQLHCDQPEEVGFKLDEFGIPFDWSDKRLRFARRGYQITPVCGFMAGDVLFELFILGLRDLRQPPLSLVDGRVIERAKLKKVEQLLAEVTD